MVYNRLLNCFQLLKPDHYHLLLLGKLHLNQNNRLFEQIIFPFKLNGSFFQSNSKKPALDKKTMKLIHDIEDLEPSIKDKLIFLANAVIRDAKTGKAYA